MKLITRLRVAYLMSYVITGRQTGVSHNGRAPRRIARTGDRGRTGEAAEITGDADVQPGARARSVVVKRMSAGSNLEIRSKPRYVGGIGRVLANEKRAIVVIRMRIVAGIHGALPLLETPQRRTRVLVYRQIHLQRTIVSGSRVRRV